jgi:hypothetical protein
MCLVVLKEEEELEKCKPVLGYLADSRLTRVPDIAKDIVSEELWYACSFWIIHVVEIDDLDKFLFKYTVPWLEVVSSKERVQDLSRAK